MQQKVTTFLWFDDRAEEAAEFYTSLFANSQIVDVTRQGDGPGKALVVRFTLDGREFLALNGGPHFQFNEAISLYVDCADQDEIDHYWSRLAAEGEPGRCGWLKDRFGLSWQVVPRELTALISDPDPEKSSRATQAMLSMGKIDLETLRKAHAGA